MNLPSLKLIYPLKIDGWKMSLSFWDGLISVVLVLGSVIQAGDLLCRKKNLTKPWFNSLVHWLDAFGKKVDLET